MRLVQVGGIYRFLRTVSVGLRGFFFRHFHSFRHRLWLKTEKNLESNFLFPCWKIEQSCTEWSIMSPKSHLNLYGLWCLGRLLILNFNFPFMGDFSDRTSLYLSLFFLNHFNRLPAKASIGLTIKILNSKSKSDRLWNDFSDGQINVISCCVFYFTNEVKHFAKGIV